MTFDQLAEIRALREGLAAEARIIEAQVLSLSHHQLGKGRREIIEKQVRRMFGASLGLNPPRSGRNWETYAQEYLSEHDG